ncbi:MAG: phage tail tube protein [Vicinamibacteria bacterium]
MSLVAAGVASFRADGVAMSVKGNMRVSVGQPIREALEVHTGPVGYKERAGLPFVEFETILESDLALDEVSQLSDIHVTVTLRDQSVYALESAWAEGEWVLETEEQTVPARFVGLRMTETRPS